MKKLTLRSLMQMSILSVAATSFVSLHAESWTDLTTFTEKVPSLLETAQATLDQALKDLDAANDTKSVRDLLGKIEFPQSPTTTAEINIVKVPANKPLRKSLQKVLLTVRAIAKKVYDKKIAATMLGQMHLSKKLDTFMKTFIHYTLKDKTPYIVRLHSDAKTDLSALYQAGKELKAANKAAEEAAMVAEDKAAPTVVAEEEEAKTEPAAEAEEQEVKE